MNYYKLIDGQNFIGVATSQNMVKFQKKHRILLSCNAAQGQYIQLNENLYRDQWMIPDECKELEYNLVRVIKIDKEEYESLNDKIEAEEEIIIEIPEPPVEIEEVVDDIKTATIDQYKRCLIQNAENTCKDKISSGFDVTLSDEKAYHFAFPEDKINELMFLNMALIRNDEKIPFRSEGESYRYYSSKDIEKIVCAANDHRTYHLSYLDSLKQYIDSFKKMSQTVKYGDAIPKKYQTDVFKAFSAKV